MIIDFDAFQEDLGLDYNHMKEFYLIFAEEICKEKEKIDRNLLEWKTDEIAKSIHNLKGVAANYRAIKVLEICKKIDMKFKNHNIENINYYLTALEEEIDETVDVIHHFFKI